MHISYYRANGVSCKYNYIQFCKNEYRSTCCKINRHIRNTRKIDDKTREFAASLMLYVRTYKR